MLTIENAVEHLRGRGVIPGGGTATLLTGGVSGVVVLVSGGDRRLVVKQALDRLSVATEWLAKPERLLTEAAALALLHEITPAHTPELVDVDPAALVLTMTAAPPGWQPWKTVLLDEPPSGARFAAVASALGRLLSAWHQQTWGDPVVAERFADYEAFEQLRVAPFHRVIRDRHPALTPAIDACITDLTTARDCLVHGDFSPKNVLVAPDGPLWVLDFEVAHVGAAVFDLAFLQCHLLLKAIHRPAAAPALRAAATAFQTGYGPTTSTRLGWHTACLLLARVDGKSPATYLTPAGRDRVRALAVHALSLPSSPPIDDLWDRAG
ncbi:phosphotransferase family enzyme [Asanoa ferruginea]|uniref:Phosphotransferase family enzyme n=1 Tax=Asanoa ferruginea TaxID=53367 RepID=A0A3D9ZBL2_9ACTN|nr:phosphotransferase [Asanoa ferruginea]REF94701.1 phosphotransferase family enzyme [Asanoa ferruginea]GIF45721.1 putative aminoglycoside phosphotransferase [Asanoa ferruginea]